MTLQEYIEWTQETDLCNENSLQYYALGLTSEAGEVADNVAKRMRINSKISDYDAVPLQEELGDCLYYIACICRTFGWTFEELAAENREKLIKRHSDNSGYCDKCGIFSSNVIHLSNGLFACSSECSTKLWEDTEK